MNEETLEKIRGLHKEAMDTMNIAFVERHQKKNKEEAKKMFFKSFEFEKKAANLLKGDTDFEPTRSILYRSAATLAVHCGNLKEAKELINAGLTKNTPVEIVNELKDLLDAIENDDLTYTDSTFLEDVQTAQEVVDQLYMLAEKYISKNKLREAESLYKRIFSIKETFVDRIEINIEKELANTQIDLAKLYFKQAKFKEAEDFYKDALEIRKEVLGDKDPEVAVVYNNLGSVYFSQGKCEEAKGYFLKALGIFDTSVSENKIAVAKTLTNLAGVYEFEANFNEANISLQKALNIYEEHGELNSINGLSAINLLGILYLSQARYEEAEKYISQALDIAKSILGKNHITTAVIMNNLGQLYTKTAGFSINKAEELLKGSLTIKQNILGQHHPDLIPSLNSLARFYLDTNKYIKAEPLFKQALSLLEQFFGGEHPYVSTIASNLGEMYLLQKKYVECKELIEKSIYASKKFFGNESKQLAISFTMMGQLFFEQSDYQEAENFLRDAVTIGEKAFGKYHPTLSAILDRLSALYKEQGKYADAELLYKQSLETSKKMGLPRAIAASQNNLAVLYLRVKNYKEAESLLEEALEITKNNLECDYNDVMVVLNSLFNLYYKQGKDKELKNSLKQLITILEKELEQENKLEDPYVRIDVLIKLGDSYTFLAKYYGLLEERDLAIKTYEKALITTKNIASIETKVMVIDNAYKSCSILEGQQELIDIAEKTNDPFVLGKLGNIYAGLGQEYIAKDLYMKALSISRKIGDLESERDNLDNFGYLYRQLRRYSLSEEHFQKALELSELIESLKSEGKTLSLADQDDLVPLADIEPVDSEDILRASNAEQSYQPNIYSRDEHLSIPFELIEKQNLFMVRAVGGRI